MRKNRHTQTLRARNRKRLRSGRGLHAAGRGSCREDGAEGLRDPQGGIRTKTRSCVLLPTGGLCVLGGHRSIRTACSTAIRRLHNPFASWKSLGHSCTTSVSYPGGAGGGGGLV